MCHVPEGRGIFPSLSVKENLLLFAPKLTRDEIAERTLGAFPTLGSRMSLAAGSLSGGEQQMLALARAYLVNPRLVLVDEASMGLAPLIVDQVFEFLNGIVQQGTALLLVEQYVNRALALADHAYILSQGRIVFAGRSAELDSASVFQRYLGFEMGHAPT
jgi:branched-chain amino acid transport system ATP-binding protein